MKFRFTGLTDPGLVRTANQDAYYTDPEGRFAIVADGMGGHAGGEEASRIATQVIQKYLVEYWDSDRTSSDLIESAFLQANQAIVQDQQQHPARADMGTTAVAVLLRHQLVCAHVGDSRLYRWRSGSLQQLTEDHTWVARALKSGDIEAEEARMHPYRHILSRCLGREDLRQIDVRVVVDVRAGDRLLLCSDGLTEELGDRAIAELLEANSSIDRTAVALIKAANANGGHDNITVVLTEIN